MWPRSLNEVGGAAVFAFIGAVGGIALACISGMVWYTFRLTVGC